MEIPLGLGLCFCFSLVPTLRGTFKFTLTCRQHWEAHDTLLLHVARLFSFLLPTACLSTLYSSTLSTGHKLFSRGRVTMCFFGPLCVLAHLFGALKGQGLSARELCVVSRFVCVWISAFLSIAHFPRLSRAITSCVHFCFCFCQSNQLYSWLPPQFSWVITRWPSLLYWFLPA